MSDAVSAPQTKRIPGPSFTAELSVFDSRFAGVFSRRVYIFKSSAEPEQVTHVFTKALKLLVQKVPVLGGQVRLADASPTRQEQWKEIVPGEGIVLKTRNLRGRMSLSDLEATNFAPEQLPDADIMPFESTVLAEPYDTAFFQLNFVDGGILLCCCIAHLVADGTSNTEITRLLAQYCRASSDDDDAAAAAELAHLLATSPPIGLDRTQLRGLKATNGWSVEHHPAMGLRDPGGRGLDSSSTGKTLPELRVKIYPISEEKLAQLKADATGDTRISTNDALMGIGWRAVVINRVAAGVLAEHDAKEKNQKNEEDEEEEEEEEEEEGETALLFPMSMRRVMDLGSDWVGNTAMNLLARSSIASVTGPDALQSVAVQVRSLIGRVDREVAHSLCEMLESSSSAQGYAVRFMSTMLTSSVFLMSFFHSESLLESDWGPVFGGRALRLRCSHLGFTGAIQGIHCVLPKMPDGQGAELQLTLFEAGIAAVETDPLFKRYLTS